MSFRMRKQVIGPQRYRLCQYVRSIGGRVDELSTGNLLLLTKLYLRVEINFQDTKCVCLLREVS